MSVPLEHFQQQITASGLISAGELAAWLDQLPAGNRPQDSRQLARELVRQKKLTAFQAQQIYAGKGRSLLLRWFVCRRAGAAGWGVKRCVAGNPSPPRALTVRRDGWWYQES